MLGQKQMGLRFSSSVKYKAILAACAIALIAFAVSTVFGPQGLSSLARMRAESNQLNRSVTELQADNERLQARIQQLESDDRYIEKIARERLGLVKPGEVVYRFDTPSRAGSAPTPSP